LHTQLLDYYYTVIPTFSPQDINNNQQRTRVPIYADREYYQRKGLNGFSNLMMKSPKEEIQIAIGQLVGIETLVQKPHNSFFINPLRINYINRINLVIKNTFKKSTMKIRKDTDRNEYIVILYKDDVESVCLPFTEENDTMTFHWKFIYILGNGQIQEEFDLPDNNFQQEYKQWKISLYI